MLEGIVGVLGTGLLAVVGWAFNLQSRVAVMEANYASLEKLLEAKLDPINQRLERIERYLNGHLG